MSQARKKMLEQIKNKEESEVKRMSKAFFFYPLNVKIKMKVVEEYERSN